MQEGFWRAYSFVAYTFILPLLIDLVIGVLFVSIPKIRNMLNEFAGIRLRESRWGIFSFLSSLVLFWLGLVLTCVTVYVGLPTKYQPLLALTIGLGGIGVLGIAYVVGLGLYYRSKSILEARRVLTVTEDGHIDTDEKYVTIEDDARVIRTSTHVIRITKLPIIPIQRTSDVPLKRGKRKRG
jgi:hypothetical protein